MQRKHDDSAANYAAYIYLIQTVLEVQQKIWFCQRYGKL